MYTIDILKEMLEKEGIPFETREQFVPPRFKKYSTGYAICYPDEQNRECDVIDDGYGCEKGLLEIQGLLTDEESEYDTVVGYLTAEEVFRRIYNDYYKKNS